LISAIFADTSDPTIIRQKKIAPQPSLRSSQVRWGAGTVAASAPPSLSDGGFGFGWLAFGFGWLASECVKDGLHPPSWGKLQKIMNGKGE
jgi:hypothetical protein